MSQTTKKPYSVYATLGAGVVLGAVGMAGVLSGKTVASAVASPSIAQPRLMSSVTAESMTELRNLDNSFRALAKFVSPAVVDIKVSSGRSMTVDGKRMPVREGQGSGFIFRSDGYILTNDHVVGNSDTVQVTLKDGHEYSGKVVRANDANSDLALVKIEARDLPTLAMADSGKVEPGEFVMAVGAPFGLENSVTIGHVSAIGRQNVIGNHVYSDLIQTDAAINMGNSGGPLVNIDGQVIGINTAIYSPSGMSAGIGFAIPSNQAKTIADLLITKGKVTRSMMGLVPSDLKEYQRAELKLPEGGALVEDVRSEPALGAGLRKGDIIVKIGATPIRGQMDLRNAMLAYSPGSKVAVEFVRDGKRQKVDLTLASYVAPKELTDSGQPRSFNMNPFGGLPDFPNLPDLNDEEEKDVPNLRSGTVQLGVSVKDLTTELRSKYSVPSSVQGAVIIDVQPDSLASRLRLKPGDVVERIGKTRVTSAEELARAVKSLKWGETGRLTYQRFGQGTQMTIDSDVTFR